VTGRLIREGKPDCFGLWLRFRLNRLRRYFWIGFWVWLRSYGFRVWLRIRTGFGWIWVCDRIGFHDDGLIAAPAATGNEEQRRRKGDGITSNHEISRVRCSPADAGPLQSHTSSVEIPAYSPRRR